MSLYNFITNHNELNIFFCLNNLIKLHNDIMNNDAKAIFENKIIIISIVQD